MKTELTESKIQRHLSGYLTTALFYIDGLFVYKWESDKLIVTQSCYVYEFEIKISKADFKADFKHKTYKHKLLEARYRKIAHTDRFYEAYNRACEYKNVTIEEFEQRVAGLYPEYFYKNEKTPNYFYYAVPEGMISKEDVPEYAGLVYVTETGGLITVKKAPKIHTEKYQHDSLNLVEKFHYNLWVWKTRADDAIANADYCRKELNLELQNSGHEESYMRLKRDIEIEKQICESYKKDLYEKEEDCRIYKREQRLLIREIRKYNPDFKIDEIREKAESKEWIY